MDLRNLPRQLSGFQRINQRRRLIEREFGVDLAAMSITERALGEAEKKNCEQMFGVVSLPVGYAGPLAVNFSNRSRAEIHLPLATTEGALVASTNRGCKAASIEGITITKSVYHGITRSIVFGLKTQSSGLRPAFAEATAGKQGYGRQAKLKASPETVVSAIRTSESTWRQAAEATSGHLKVKGYDLDLSGQYVFLTVSFDTDEAMGMNMATIASQAIADSLTNNSKGLECVTVAGNVDSDKKPSRRTYERGRGHEVVCSVHLSAATIADVLKSTPEAMLAVADAKLKTGSALAGAIGKNLHVANIIAALYIATGQDPAHVTEGSLADTTVTLPKRGNGLDIEVRLPAIIVGVRGGGTGLPAQSQCLQLLLKPNVNLHKKTQLAESIAAAVLAGEISLLAAQASHELASAHVKLAR